MAKICGSPWAAKMMAACLAALTVGLAGQAFAAATFQHVLIISIDGLHEADLHDPALTADMPNILALAHNGIDYTHASCSTPSDSFPGSAAYFTGASPKTTGIYFDDSYSRTLFAPGSDMNSPAGAMVGFTGEIDKNPQRLDGGGDCGLGSIDPDKLPLARIDGKLVPVYPHNYIKVNTIFEVAHQAGLRTALIDKHPCYDLANGPSGKGLDDLYGPESDAQLALIKGQLYDASTIGQSTHKDKKLKKPTKSVAISNAFDDLRMAALLNQIQGKDARGAAMVGVPALFGINLIAVNTAQKLDDGGIEKKTDGSEVVSDALHEALQHNDGNIGQIVQALKDNNLYDSTLIVLTAKHAQGPRLGSATTLPLDTFNSVLLAKGIRVVQATQDDVGLYWLRDQSQTASAATLLSALPPANGIAEVLWGPSLVAAGFGDPAADDRAPNIIVKLKPGFLIHDKPKRAEHGGFSEDDTHVALILSGGLPANLRGTTQDAAVKSTQIAVTALEALGLDPAKLQGAVLEKTPSLPGLKKD